LCASKAELLNALTFLDVAPGFPERLALVFTRGGGWRGCEACGALPTFCLLDNVFAANRADLLRAAGGTVVVDF
jgi:hypothetical protein